MYALDMYIMCEYDCFVYVKSLDDGSFIFLLLNINDVLIVAKNMTDVDKLKNLSRSFDMKGLCVSKKILLRKIRMDRKFGRL